MPAIPPILYQRAIEGISAVLLPWTPDGKIDFDSYQRGLERTWKCGLTPAINMDTGYANLLSVSQRKEVLAIVEPLAAGRRFVAGAFVEDLDGDVVRNYVDQCVGIQEAGGIPILFQSTKLTQQPRPQLISAYRTIARECDKVIGFELGKMFVPFGEIYDLDTFRELLSIPSLIGIKHSSLSREQEWQRLSIRNQERPEFRVYTGNDLAIDMVQWGSDYLLGLSAFCPEAFSKRDAYWQQGDSRFYELNDWLQYLGFPRSGSSLQAQLRNVLGKARCNRS
jgi:dihydrodipicolinate synthase/N-acetylneuraminate lyase